MCPPGQKNPTRCLTSPGCQGLRSSPNLPQTRISAIKVVPIMLVSPSQRGLLDMELRQDLTLWMIFHLPSLSERQKISFQDTCGILPSRASCRLVPGASLASVLCPGFQRKRGLLNGQRGCVEGPVWYRTFTCSALCGGRVRCLRQFPSSCFMSLREATKHHLSESQQNVQSWVCI